MRTIDAALPKEYHTGMTKFLVSVKKEKKKAKEKGYLDEEEADPIAFPLYKLISQWFLEEDDIMSFAFTVLQWGCMVRSINIDPLGFHNFSKGQEDSIEIIYGATKAYKRRVRMSCRRTFLAILLIIGYVFSLPLVPTCASIAISFRRGMIICFVLAIRKKRWRRRIIARR